MVRRTAIFVLSCLRVAAVDASSATRTNPAALLPAGWEALAEAAAGAAADFSSSSGRLSRDLEAEWGGEIPGGDDAEEGEGGARTYVLYRIPPFDVSLTFPTPPPRIEGGEQRAYSAYDMRSPSSSAFDDPPSQSSYGGNDDDRRGDDGRDRRDHRDDAYYSRHPLLSVERELREATENYLFDYLAVFLSTLALGEDGHVDSSLHSVNLKAELAVVQSGDGDGDGDNGGVTTVVATFVSGTAAFRTSNFQTYEDAMGQIIDVDQRTIRAMVMSAFVIKSSLSAYLEELKYSENDLLRTVLGIFVRTDIDQKKGYVPPTSSGPGEEEGGDEGSSLADEAQNTRSGEPNGDGGGSLNKGELIALVVMGCFLVVFVAGFYAYLSREYHHSRVVEEKLMERSIMSLRMAEDGEGSGFYGGGDGGSHMKSRDEEDDDEWSVDEDGSGDENDDNGEEVDLQAVGRQQAAPPSPEYSAGTNPHYHDSSGTPTGDNDNHHRTTTGGSSRRGRSRTSRRRSTNRSRRGGAKSSSSLPAMEPIREDDYARSASSVSPITKMHQRCAEYLGVSASASGGASGSSLEGASYDEETRDEGRRNNWLSADAVGLRSSSVAHNSSFGDYSASGFLRSIFRGSDATVLEQNGDMEAAEVGEGVVFKDFPRHDGTPCLLYGGGSAPLGAEGDDRGGIFREVADPVVEKSDGIIVGKIDSSDSDERIDDIALSPGGGRDIKTVPPPGAYSSAAGERASDDSSGTSSTASSASTPRSSSEEEEDDNDAGSGPDGFIDKLERLMTSKARRYAERAEMEREREARRRRREEERTRQKQGGGSTVTTEGGTAGTVSPAAGEWT